MEMLLFKQSEAETGRTTCPGPQRDSDGKVGAQLTEVLPCLQLLQTLKYFDTKSAPKAVKQEQQMNKMPPRHQGKELPRQKIRPY